MENERKELLYVELPNLIHRILKISTLSFPKSERKVEITTDIIKKIANAECDSALANFKK